LIGLKWLRIGIMTGSYDDGDEFSGSIKGCKSLNKLTIYYLVKKVSALFC
jgi:hypothetical protein